MGIRQAELKDVPQLSALCKKTFYEAYSWYNTESDLADYMASHFTEKQLSEEIQTGHISYFIFTEGESFLGYVELMTGREPEQTTGKKSIEIARYYVDGAYQGKKIGKQLMEFCFDFANEQNYDLIWLGVWKKNTRAIEIYQHYGFIISGTTVFVLGSDPQEDYIMIKEIGAGNKIET